MQTRKYFKNLESEVKKVYSIAEKARSLGLDPVDHVEVPLAMTMAEKVVGLISTLYPQLEKSGVTKRILELEKEYGKLDIMVVFKIAEEVAKEKFCKFSSLLKAIDAGIRVGFAYHTLGVVSPPVEGFTHLKLGKTKDGKEYFKAYFSGPIRAAGTTATCVVLILIDYLRELFGYAKYDPTEDEIRRYVAESLNYHERITNLQYMPTEEEMVFLAKNLPIQIDGEPTERMEVSNYKNLERVETNFIRGGMCLTFAEGLAQKAAKGHRLLLAAKSKGIKATGFDFLKEYIELHEKREGGKADDSPTYINDLVAGRPVFGHPSRSGGFRFRYGRGRTSGFSAASLHPATMAITDGFIATGTQLKIEKPTKGCVVTSCDSIEGPIVKMFNGSVKKISSIEEAKKVYTDVEEIIYLGDLLFPWSDVANRNYDLLKPGYVEEWWALELKEKSTKLNKNFNLNFFQIEEATRLSEEYKIPLHPKYILYWTQISEDEFLELIEWLKRGKIYKKMILPYTKTEQEKYSLGKRALELLGVEHEVTIENVIIGLETSKVLFSNLGLDLSILEKDKESLMKDFFSEENFKKFNSGENVLDIINKVSKFEIKDKAGSFIGARMGRPEKAKLRKLTGSPNVLFPVGNEGGRLRSVQSALEFGGVRSNFPLKYCNNCKKETIYFSCEDCGNKTEKMFYCYGCKDKFIGKACGEHGKEFRNVSYQNREIDIVNYFDKAVKKLNLSKEDIPPLIKGIRGTSSENHVMEHLAKGIARAMFNLQVNKDGTVRYDVTELPIVSFKPKEISVGVEKLKELGYEKDIYGNDLKEEDQILELMPHDILLPSLQNSLDERADEVFFRVAKFVDYLLRNFYGMEPLYNLKSKEDLVGKLGVCMAPHNVAGVICRFIGFSSALGGFASPYMHAAVRRDCDGDEFSIMLLGDVLLNFSKEFLPGHRGGTQDAPLVLNAKIDAGEVDDAILDFEYVNPLDGYPLELYQLAEQSKHSSEVKKIVIVKDILKKGENPFINIGFTHDTQDLNDTIACSSYKILPTMQEKVQHQMGLVEKIRAAETSDTARLILERHFIRDMRGNLRKFSMQSFRCVGCNEILRRPPLMGVCPRCKGKIIFTVHEGGIKKYLEPAMSLAKEYNLSNYIKEVLDLTKEDIDSIFGKELEKQEALGKWF